MALVHGRGGLHIDFVDIWAFFSVDLDIDEMLGLI
jgi:hypothetical protein